MSKFQNGATVRVIDNEKLYSAYIDFMYKYARDFIGEWEKWRGIASGSIGRIVAQAKHPSYNDYLYVIKTKDGVFIMGERGLELTTEPPQSTPLEQAAERYALAVKMCVMCGSTCSAGSKRKNDCPFKGVDKKGFNCQQYAAILPETQKIMEDYLAAEQEKPAEKPQDKPQYMAGDKAIITGNKTGHPFDNGEVVELYEYGAKDWRCRNERVNRDLANWVLESDMKPYTEQKPVEPVKLYCVKDCNPKACGCVIKGKVYEQDERGFIHGEHGLCTAESRIRDGHLVPLVKRPAKIGEYIIPMIVDGWAKNDRRYDVHDLLKVTSDDTTIIAQWVGKAVGFKNITHPERPWQHCVILHANYLVLDGYKGENQ